MEEEEEEDENKKSRALKCETCNYPLRQRFDPNDTSTWREDNYCSARCKRQAPGRRTWTRTE